MHSVIHGLFLQRAEQQILDETYSSPTKLLFTSSTKRPLWKDGINIRLEDELDAASQNLLGRSHRQEEEGRSNHELL